MQNQCLSVLFSFKGDQRQSCVLEIGNIQVYKERKTQRIRFSTISLHECDVIPNKIITLERDLIHLALFFNVNLFNYEETTTIYVCIFYIEQEIKEINKNQTRSIISLPT